MHPPHDRTPRVGSSVTTRLRPAIVGGALVVALLPSHPARAQDAALAPYRATSCAIEQPSEGTPHVQRQPITWLAVTGLSMFGLVYLAGIPGAAAVSESEGSKFSGKHASVMAIPFAGPWLEASGSVEKESTRGAPALVAMGVLQVVGATLAAVGLIGRNEIVGSSEAQLRPPRALHPDVFVTPTAAGEIGGAGLSLRGAM